MNKLSLLWKKFHKLHLGLYFLFFLMTAFGSVTSAYFEKFSLIDLGRVKAEIERAAAQKAKGGSYSPSETVYREIFHPVNFEPREVVYIKNGKAEKRTETADKGNYISLYFLLLAAWLWPLYRHYFSGKPQDPARVESRVINLPIVVFALGWVMALQLYFVKVASFSSLYGPAPGRMKLVFAVSSLIFAAFVSYLNLELTGLYIRARIAGPFFRENNPYGLKKGFAISLTLRYALMLFSLAMVPLLISLYLPAFANFDLFARLKATSKSGWDWVLTYDNMRTLVTILLVALFAAMVLVFQAASLLLYRFNVQAPISALLRRMKAVAAGDFSGRTSVLYADEFGQLKGHFNLMVDGLREREERLEAARAETSRLESELAVSKATSDLAAQVAHDIRSPLAAMSAAARGLELPPAQRELLGNSARRIQEIADDLLRRYRAPSAGREKEKPRPCLLAGLIEATLAEKRLQYKDRAGVRILFEAAGEGARAVVEPKDFQRLVSNLVNNAVEAFDGGGTVAVKLSSGDGVLIEVKDDGRGIPAELLPGLGRKGGTHGKEGGTGLGLYHARACAEGWGGKLEIISAPGAGTTVSVRLPAAAAAPVRSAALLDDDPLVHMNWRLAAKAAGAELKAFETPDAFYRALDGLPKSTPIYLDSELGGGVKGEEIARDLREKGYTDITLATGHSAEAFADLPWLKVAGKEPPFG